MKGLRLYKKERLCSKKAIDALFDRQAGSDSALAYPLRAVWRLDHSGCPCHRFMIVVPKRRLRHAVDRVTMRRRIRESYRLNRHLLEGAAPASIGFVFVGDEVKDYRHVEKAMTRLLSKITASTSHESAQ